MSGPINFPNDKRDLVTLLTFRDTPKGLSTIISIIIFLCNRKVIYNNIVVGKIQGRPADQAHSHQDQDPAETAQDTEKTGISICPVQDTNGCAHIQDLPERTETHEIRPKPSKSGQNRVTRNPQNHHYYAYGTRVRATRKMYGDLPTRTIF